ncbi:hypothetical protein INR49_020698 [Caranx melampygus]|nr:hypothetical protein INR49_020698 [Caranx melampygus]
MRRVFILLAVLCVCEGVRFGQLCSGNPTNRRRTSDTWGSGHYGAGRRRNGQDSKPHEGVDIVCQDGSDVYAPFDVTLNGRLLVYNRPEKAAIDSGINLRGEGGSLRSLSLHVRSLMMSPAMSLMGFCPAGLCFKLFYVRPDRTSGTVRKGQKIGTMLPMQSVYPG